MSVTSATSFPPVEFDWITMLVFGLHCHCLYACLSSVLERGCLDGRWSPSAALCYSWCLVAGERKISRRVGELKSGIKQYVDGLGCVVNVAHVTPTLPTDEPRWPSPVSGLRQSRIAPPVSSWKAEHGAHLHKYFPARFCGSGRCLAFNVSTEPGWQQSFPSWLQLNV